MGMIILSKYIDKQIVVMTDKHSVAELSCVIPIKGFDEPTFYFHRIKVKPENEGTGEGRELMIEVCRYADQLGATIYNELNPYGKRDMKSLKQFFKASDFEDYGDPENNIMIRKPKDGQNKI
jgi:GNAT superfamily N-acetyltransferase